MHTPIFRESYDKIIEAYFKDEIKPMKADFCICGTLAGNSDWYNANRKLGSPYSRREYRLLESALFEGIRIVDGNAWADADPVLNVFCANLTEGALFNGMSMALDVLRKIHESRGEVIESFEFKKRELTTV